MHTNGQEVLSALRTIMQVKQRGGRVWDLEKGGPAIHLFRANSPIQLWAEELTGAKALGWNHVYTQEKARRPVEPEGSEGLPLDWMWVVRGRKESG